MLNPGTAPAQQATDKMNKRFGEGMWAYSQQKPSPGQAQPQQSPYANSTPYAAYAPASTGMNQQQRDQAMAAWTMPKQQLLQWGQGMPQTPGLAPQQGMTPDQSWNAVSNVIGQVNNATANQQVGTYLGAGAPPAGWGQTSYDPQAMWANATRATQQGWENPFTPRPSNPPPPPPPPRLPSPGMAQPIPSQIPEAPIAPPPPPDLTRYERAATEMSRAAQAPNATQSDQLRAAAAQRDLQEARGYADILATDGEGSQRMAHFRQASQKRQSREWREREARLGQSVYPQANDALMGPPARQPDFGRSQDAPQEPQKPFDYAAARADWMNRNKQAVRALPPAWRATLAGLNKSLYG